jgi:uncharacterized protein
MITTAEALSTLTVGAVESVAADAIDILLDSDAPRAIALNSGVPSGFPRINGYILIPNEGGALIGLITRLWIERSRLVRTADKELIDLPFPLRKLTVTPVGTLGWTADSEAESGYRTAFKRGVTVFPSVGDSVVLPTSDQLRAIIESDTHTRRVTIGTSPLLANSEISLDPDRLFGGHLAVLGNTGSGKSCSVAGFIRWSIEAAKGARVRARKNETPNARFIVLDPNGEYKNSFADLPGGVRVYQIPPPEPGTEALTVPAWMWNTSEWSAFASAAPAIQRPILQQTLRGLRSGAGPESSFFQTIRRRMSFVVDVVNQKIASGGEAYGKTGAAMAVGDLLKALAEDGTRYLDNTDGSLKRVILELVAVAEQMREEHRYPWKNGKDGFNPFSETEMLKLQAAIAAVIHELPPADTISGRAEDAPIRFNVEELPDYLEHVASHTSTQASALTAGLVVRIRNMLADSKLSSIISPEDPPSFPEWLENHIGADAAANGPVTVIDLSLVPTEIVHLVVAVIGRVVFEALQRYMRTIGEELPTVLVLEEAHTFVSRGREDESTGPSATDMCRTTFERIAREGRKFGLGLVISSQRPSEISPTVLSQCNTFLLHRLVNDRDQDLVGRLVPDTIGGMLRELPTLPARHAIIVGQATPLPLLVEINELQLEHRPRSSNPRFWDTWVGKKFKPIDWDVLVDEWEQ